VDRFQQAQDRDKWWVFVHFDQLCDHPVLQKDSASCSNLVDSTWYVGSSKQCPYLSVQKMKLNLFLYVRITPRRCTECIEGNLHAFWISEQLEIIRYVKVPTALPSG